MLSGGPLSGGFSLKLLIALLQQWYYSLDYWKELERERVREGENRLLLERQKTYTKMSCRHSMRLAIV